MDALLELYNSIPTDDLPVIDRSSMPSDAAYSFYQDLEKGLITNDDVAIDSYFSDKSNAKKYYASLKNRIYSKLATSFITSKRKGANSTQQAYFEIYRDFFIAKELRARGKNKAFTKLAEKVIEKSIKFDLSETVVSLSKDLILVFSTIEGNIRKFKKYNTLLREYSNRRNAEESITSILCELALTILTSRNPSNISTEDYEYKLNDAHNIFKAYPTQKISTYYFTIQTTYNELKNDLWSTLHYCKEALAHFEKLKIVPPVGNVFMFLHKQVNIHIRLKQYEEAKACLDHALSILAKHSPNWHIAKNYEATLAFHQGDYNKANEVIQKALKNKKELSDAMTEQWTIMQAYGHLLAPNTGKRFRLARFLNQVPIFSKDKRGHNTNILILQIIFLLKSKKYNDIIDRVEALKKYASIHLRKDDTFRSSCFIKMLHLLPAGNFHPANVKRRTAKYYERMTSLPIGEQRMDIDVEVVPYETLWEVVLNLL